MRKLTNRQRLFIEEYLVSWNASDAARRAGYKGAANAVGSRMLANDSIREAISARMAEKAMKADENLQRLSDQARINISEFVSEKTRYVYDKDGNEIGEYQVFELNWDQVKKRGHLIKSITNTQWGPRIELYDGQTALIQIGKALGVLTERVDFTSKGDKLDVVFYLPDNNRHVSNDDIEAENTAD